MLNSMKRFLPGLAGSARSPREQLTSDGQLLDDQYHGSSSPKALLKEETF